MLHTITAFEPDPDNAALLRANLERNHASRVQVVTNAVSDSEREATLHRYAGNKRRTADVLGCSVKTLYNKLNRYAQAAGQN